MSRYRLLTTAITIISTALVMGFISPKPLLSDRVTSNEKNAVHSYQWIWNELKDLKNPTSVVFGKNGEIYIGAQEGGIQRSTDGGKHWKTVTKGIRGCFVYSLAVDSKGIIYAATGCGVYRSKNNGEHWTLSSKGLDGLRADHLAVSLKDVIYVRTSDEGVFRSTDHGLSWKRVCPGINGSVMSSVIAVDSKGNIFSALDSGLYRFDNRGGRWRKLNLGKLKGWVASVAVDSEDNIYAGLITYTLSRGPQSMWTGESAVMKSSDHGKSWKALRLRGTYVSGCNILAGHDGTIIVAGYSGIFESRDKGAHWRILIETGYMPEKLPWERQAVELIAVDSAGNICAIGTRNYIFYGRPEKRRSQLIL